MCCIRYQWPSEKRLAFTSEVTLLLSSFPGLKVHSGLNMGTDAVLVGIVESDDFLDEVVETSSVRFTSGSLNQSIGGRSGFYIPSRSRVNLSLRVVLIKHPSRDDFELIHHEQLKDFVAGHPKVIFDTRMSLSRQFSRTIDDTRSLDRGGVVNFTKNHHNINRSVREMAQSASNNLKDLVLNVF